MADNINYLLGAPTYTNEKQQRVATGEGAYGQMEDYMQQYLNRGDWRMAMDQGASSPYGPLQHRDASGVWSDWTNPIVGYDPRQDANTLDSNERRRFNQGFLQGNTGTDLRGDNLQTVAVQNGWKEPPRNDKTTLMSMVGDIAPYVGLFAGGVGALNGLAGMLGATGNTASLMSGLGDVTADIAAGTGELGSSTANLMSGLGDVTADIAAGTGELGSSTANLMSGLGDTVADLGGHSMSDLMSGLGDTVADLPGMDALDPRVIDLFDKAGMPGFDGYGNPLDSIDPRVIDLFDKAGTPGYNNYGEPLTWYEQLLQGLSGGKSLFQLGSTASDLLGLGTKLLSGLDLVRRNRQALNTNDQRLRDSKDATPLSATSFNMLRPTALRRAKGGLVQMAEGGSPLEKARTELREWLKGVEMPMTNRSNVLAGLEQPRYATPDEIVSMLDAPFKVGEDGEKSYYPRRQLRGPMPVHDTYRRAMHDIGYPVGINGIIPTDQSLEFDDAMQGHAKGGLAQCAECGAGSSTPRYVQGGTSGQSDKIPALLSDGEYVFDADSVAALGDGNNAAGAAALDQMRQNIRKHKRSAPVSKIPPKAKQPEHYLKGAK